MSAVHGINSLRPITVGSASSQRSERCEASRSDSPTRGVVDPAMCRHPRTSEVRATVVNGWDVRPTLDRANANRRPLAQAAGSFVAGSPLPQAPIQRRQWLTYELRLSTLVILSRPAPQLAAGDSAVAQPTTTPFTRLVRAPEPIGDIPPRHILAQRHSAHSTACRAVWLYAAWLPNLVQPPQVAPPSRSKLAPNPRSVS